MTERRRIKTTSQRVQPQVDDYDRESMLRWLQWNDQNGCYTDEVALHERRPTLTYDEARELYEAAVGDLAEEDFEPRPRARTTEELAQEAQQKVANALNYMSLSPAEFAKAYMSEHRTGQQTFARFALAFFMELAAQEHGDLRNEDARKLARFIKHTIEEHESSTGGCVSALRLI